MKKRFLIITIIAIFLITVCCTVMLSACDEEGSVVFNYIIHPNNGGMNIVWSQYSDFPEITNNNPEYAFDGLYYDSAFTRVATVEQLQTAILSGDRDIYVHWKYIGCNHNWIIDKEVPATCTESGLTQGKHCSLCNQVAAAQTIIPSLGHDIVQYGRQEPTCYEKGNEAYETCTREGCTYTTYQEIATLPHEFAPWVEELSATCTEKGEKGHYRCINCYHYYAEDGVTEIENLVIGELPHQWHWVVDRNATVNLNGVKHEECSACRHTRNMGTSIPMISCSHTYSMIAHAGSSATCTENGKKDYYYCTDCRRYFEDIDGTVLIYNLGEWENTIGQGISYPLGHNLESVEGKEADCISEGYKPYERCTREGCTYNTFEVVSAKGHIETSWLYTYIDGEDNTSCTINCRTLCSVCNAELNNKDIDITLNKIITSYTGKNYTIKAMTSEAVPESLQFIYENNVQSKEGIYDIKMTFADIEGNPLFVDELTGNPKFLANQLQILKDGKYWEVTFQFDEDPTHNVSIGVPNNYAIDLADMPELPDIPGYRGGWNYNGEVITSDTLLTKVYSIDTFIIDYIVPEGIENNEDNPLTYNIETETFELLSPTTEEGLTFQGWYLDEVYSRDKLVLEIEKGTVGDIVLYAKIVVLSIKNADGYNINFDDYGYTCLTKVLPAGTTSWDFSAIEVYSGSTLIISEDMFGTVVYENKRVPIVSGHNYTYLRVVQPDESVVVYYADLYCLSSVNCGFFVDNRPYGDIEPYEELSVIEAPEEPIKDGYTFLGWTLSEDSEDLVQFPMTFLANDKNDDDARITHTAPDFVFSFYAKFTPTKYNFVMVYVEDEEPSETEAVNYNASYTPPIPTRPGYSFIGWEYGTVILPSTFTWTYDQDVTVVAQWTIATYSITYILNEGLNSFTNPTTFTYFEEVVLEYPTKEFYNFGGWYKESTFESQIEIISGISEDLTLYAKWNYITATITYELHGGTNAESNIALIGGNELPFTLADPSRLGYVFNGWYSDNSLNGQQITTITELADITVHAVFAGTKGLEYTYIANGDYYTISGYMGTETEILISDTYAGKNIKRVSASAFALKMEITTVKIPYTVKTIETNAFKNCIALVNLYIDSGVEAIGENAFFGCTALRNVTLPNSVNSVGQGAFGGCVSLESITTPYATTNVFGSIFGETEDLNCYPISTKNSSNTYYWPKSLKSVTLTGGRVIEEGFYGSKITSLTINGCGSISKNAFENCTELTVVSISLSSGAVIGENAFAGSSNIRNIHLGTGVVGILKGAFADCANKLTTLTFDNPGSWYATLEETKYNNKKGGDLVSSANMTDAERLSIFTQRLSYYYFYFVDTSKSE